MLDFVFVTKIDHLHTIKLSIQKISELYPANAVYIVTKRSNFKFFRFRAKVKMVLVDEDGVLPDMKGKDLEKLPVSHFPERSGWYYQQLLKLGMHRLEGLSDDYVVVDADTIFLKRMTFIDEEGRYVFLKSTEHHRLYFENYRRLLKEDAGREFSFISQYMVFNKRIVREMLDRIEENFNGSDSWNWLIMKNLEGRHHCLFSEYETYGHYIKNHHPEKCSFTSVKWLRNGTDLLNSTLPGRKDLDAMSDEYHLVSFELRWKGRITKIRNRVFKNVYPYYSYLTSAFGIS
jgi:hypothetical protein